MEVLNGCRYALFPFLLWFGVNKSINLQNKCTFFSNPVNWAINLEGIETDPGLTELVFKRGERVSVIGSAMGLFVGVWHISLRLAAASVMSLAAAFSLLLFSSFCFAFLA